MTHPHLTAQCRIDTPLGPMTAAATDKGIAGLWFNEQAHHPGPLDVPVKPDQRWLKSADAYLKRYFEADWPAQRSLPLDLHGTPFQRAVWQALLALQPAETSTYAAIAAQAGSPAGVRAAARPSAAIRCRCWCPATAWSGPTARSPAMPVAWNAGRGALLLHEGVALSRGLDDKGQLQQTVEPQKHGRNR